MCYQNYTQHNGCGHIGEAHAAGFTLCDAARQRLNALRGPNSPPISPSPNATFATPKRSSSTRRFFSLSNTLSRSSTSASRSSRRSASGPAGGGGKPHSFNGAGGDYMSAQTYTSEHDVPLHQLIAARCPNPTKRTQVSSKMDVCKECKRWIREMRFMLERYDKTGNIRGLAAFEEFLRERGEGGGESECDMTVPVEGGIEGLKGIQPRQAIIMGYPDNEFGGRGLGRFTEKGDF